MFPHGGSGNHGCEAIVRTSVNMFKDDFDITLFSDAISEDNTYLSDTFVSISSPRKVISRNSLAYIFAIFRSRLTHDSEAYDKLAFHPIISTLGNNTVLMSIGGDNYCYGENEFIYLVNRCAKKRNAKTVLWGCSVEPSAISPAMAKDLESYDLIIARESITYDTLKSINPNTVLAPDPAFTLQKSEGIYPEGLKEKPYIGINISPMIQSKESVPGITADNYCQLIDHILTDTTDNIALIPHVVWTHNNDRIPLQTLFDKYKESGRVFMVEDQNCQKLKDIISGCRMFIGARTHATIAAYSTCVPTLVIGYSVKARGIARDLFGTDDHYVLPVQNLATVNDLSSAFDWLHEHELYIRNHLSSIMSDYIKKAYSITRNVKELQ